MNDIYEYRKSWDGLRYYFESTGTKGVIPKGVFFEEVDDSIEESYYTVVLFDYVNNEWTYVNNSNNGDMYKVLRTIVAIMEDFAAPLKPISIFFVGLTEAHRLFYHRAIANNNGKMGGFVIMGQKSDTAPYETFNKSEKYTGFLAVME
jgi:hypothetical protein